MAITTPFDTEFDFSISLTAAQKTALTYFIIALVTAPIAIWAAIQNGDVGLFEECFDALTCAAS